MARLFQPKPKVDTNTTPTPESEYKRGYDEGYADGYQFGIAKQPPMTPQPPIVIEVENKCGARVVLPTGEFVGTCVLERGHQPQFPHESLAGDLGYV